MHALLHTGGQRLSRQPSLQTLEGNEGSALVTLEKNEGSALVALEGNEGSALVTLEGKEAQRQQLCARLHTTTSGKRYHIREFLGYSSEHPFV